MGEGEEEEEERVDGAGAGETAGMIRQQQQGGGGGGSGTPARIIKTYDNYPLVSSQDKLCIFSLLPMMILLLLKQLTRAVFLQCSLHFFFHAGP